MHPIRKRQPTWLHVRIRQRRRIHSYPTFSGGGVFKNGCESNFDCEQPQVCCDVGFKRNCCSNGLGIVDGIPVERFERIGLPTIG